MKSGLFLPPLPIPPEASAVHHITNKMLVGKPGFKDSPEWKEVKELSSLVRKLNATVQDCVNQVISYAAETERMKTRMASSPF